MTMPTFMLWVAGFILLMVALGMTRIIYGPARADRMMAVQLLGTGGIAVLLLLAVATDVSALLDVALLLGLLAAFASAAFIMSAVTDEADAEEGEKGE